MKRSVLILLACMIISLPSWSSNTRVIVKANSKAVTYVGRTQSLPDGSVRYDWVGVYLQTAFSGGSIAFRVSESGQSYHNIFIDGKFIRKIRIASKDTLINLASGLSKGFHQLRVQKCTEGEFGCTTIHQFLLSPKSTMKVVPKKNRMIEIFGDSYTCGYGSEDFSATAPFKVEKENCNKAYGSIIARYFNADYAFIAHSGRGMVRNYGDSLQLSKNTMTTRMTHVFDDFDASVAYDFKAYKPDLVMINLGTNDFSTQPFPTDKQFIDGYIKFIKQLRKIYGDVPILCIIPHSGGPVSRCLPVLMKEMTSDKNLYLSNPMENIISYQHDMGAATHPNYTGHKKIAMTLIPKISVITGWFLENKVIE